MVELSDAMPTPIADIQPSLAGDPAYLCVWNNSNQLMYYSIHYDGSAGIANFTLRPREMQRINIGTSTGICYYDYQPIPPNGVATGFAIQEYAGNCP